MGEQVKDTTAVGDGAVVVPATLDEAKAALASEQAKNVALLNEVVGLEEEIVNRCMADFDSVVSEESRAYWREQLLTNRKGALVALNELAVAKKGAAPAAGAVRPPLHNRAVARPVAPAAVGGGGSGAGSGEDRAAKIRNRAQEISKAERVPFSAAFKRAERELAG